MGGMGKYACPWANIVSYRNAVRRAASVPWPACPAVFAERQKTRPGKPAMAQRSNALRVNARWPVRLLGGVEDARMRNRICRTILVALLLALSSSAGAAPAKFRDFKVYTTSAPDPADLNRVVGTMRLVNAGAGPLGVHVSLKENAAAGVKAGTFDARIEPGKDATWSFDIRPPAELKREVLTGSITFDGAPGSTPGDRELYVAVQGTDPAKFADPRVAKITAKAEVVGTHAPRTDDAIRKVIEASQVARPPGGAAIILAAQGETKYRVALDAPDNQDVTDAVADLQRVVKQVTGAELPVAKGGATAAAAPAIRIRQIPAPADWAHPDDYRLSTQGEDVVIEATTPDGLRHGIYGLLTDHLDCHWFMPKRLGEEFPAPADRTLRMRRVSEVRVPSFFSSYSLSWNSAPNWDRQSRSLINRGRMNFGHSWVTFIHSAKYPFEKFPDMWSRDRAGKLQKFDVGWSNTNFCSTSPEVIKIVAEKIDAQFDANPDAIVASLDPNDMAPMCQCDRCLALDKSYGVAPTDDKQMADRLVHFSNEIHKRLKPAHQQKFLGILAYAYQTRPPKNAVPHDRHATIVCQFPGYFDHTRPFNDPTSPNNREFESIVKGWGGKVKQLGFYDYYGHYEFFGPWGIVHKIREDLPAFRELGGGSRAFVVIESQPNWAMHGLNLYVASRLVWDVDADVDALVEEYVTKFYGPAAGPMREFYRTAERHYALTRPGVMAAHRVGERAEFWDEADGQLKRAEEAVRGLKDADRRFADRVTFARDGFDFGRRAFQLGGHANDEPWLRETKTMFDRMKAKYTPDSEQWPTMIPGYFWPDVDAMLKKFEKPKG
jgi:hypothetical protein